MSETQGGVAEAQEKEEAFIYPVKVEEAGPATKKVTVDIPAERIAAKLDEEYKDLRKAALVPGFRVGHAPRKLVEKRFHNEVREQVRRELLSESYQQAVEKNDLRVLGEPEFEDAEKIKLPDDGAMSYSFQVEVRPDIALPELMNLHVKKAKVQVTEANLEAGMTNLREQAGALTPVEDRGVQGGDYLIADVHVKVGDEVVVHQHGGQLVSRAGRLAGIQLDDLAKQVEGMRPGEKRTIEAHAPDTHADERLKGKDVRIEIELHEIKKMQLADIDEAFLEDLGFKNEQELRQALKEQMDVRVAMDVRRAMHDQVRRYLMDNTTMDLPTKLTERQTNRIVSRRQIDLQLRGVAPEQAMAMAEELRGPAKEEAVRELKLFFILQKIAEDRNVDATEAELNGQIATLAAQRGERPEKLKQELAKNGRLLDLYMAIRETKALDNILESAQIEEVEPEPAK